MFLGITEYSELEGMHEDHGPHRDSVSDLAVMSTLLQPAVL